MSCAKRNLTSAKEWRGNLYLTRFQALPSLESKMADGVGKWPVHRFAENCMDMNLLRTF